MVTVTAFPEPGEAFLGWSGDAVGLDNPLVLAMDRSRTVIARFTKHPRVNLQLSGKDGALLTVNGEFTGAYRIQRSSDLASWSEVLAVTNAYGEAQAMFPATGPVLYFRAVQVGAVQRRATAVPTVVNGFVIAITIIDGGEGYITTPQITIIGGGGTGAAATAIVKDGKVEKAIVVNAGSGYSQPPSILIAAPGQ